MPLPLSLADLHGLAPTQRAKRIVQQCARQRIWPALRDCMARAQFNGAGLHICRLPPATCHLLDDVLSWPSRHVETGQR